MINKLHIQNYKSIERCELDFSRINVLIGPNGSGKTSILECFGHLKVTSANIVSFNRESAHPYISLRGVTRPLFPFEHFVFQRNMKRSIEIKFTFTSLPLIGAELTFNRSTGTIKLAGEGVTDTELRLIPQKNYFPFTGRQED